MRDRLGNEMFRKQDAQGRPLKLVSQPPSEAYDKGWEETFGKPKRRAVRRAKETQRRIEKMLKEAGSDG